MKVVIVAPAFDEATMYSFAWAKRLASTLPGVEATPLWGGRVSRAEVERALESHPEAVYIHYDHGTEDAHWGSESERVVDLHNVHMLKGRVAYTMNCLSAKKLGAVAHSIYGCVYIGYVKEFAFVPDEEELFSEAANYGMVVYASGAASWAEVKKAMVQKFDECIARAKSPWSKIWLMWDRDALRVYAEGVDKPESDCPFRRAALSLLGRWGWASGRALVGQLWRSLKRFAKRLT